jgi:acyl-CoA reductase-like NAD-dependent aldehyde dehydrogenase
MRGLPPGVLNLVTGYRPVVGEALITNPGVDLVTFTGSESVGQTIAAAVAQAHTLGDQFDADTKMGPLVSAEQRERVREDIRRGHRRGRPAGDRRRP